MRMLKKELSNGILLAQARIPTRQRRGSVSVTFHLAGCENNNKCLIININKFGHETD